MRYNHEEKQDPADIKPGIYSWVCVDAAEKTSVKSGYDYINVKLAVNIPSAAEPINTYDTLSSHPKALWKIEQFCELAGLDFEANQLNVESCIGKQGKAEFVFGAPKDNGRKYLEVKRYITEEDDPFANDPETTTPPIEEDDIPF